MKRKCRLSLTEDERIPDAVSHKLDGRGSLPLIRFKEERQVPVGSGETAVTTKKTLGQC